MTDVITFPGIASRPSKAQRESARMRFPPRPVVTDWPATRQERGEVWERLTSGMFVLDNANSQERRVRGLAWLLDWLADQPGKTINPDGSPVSYLRPDSSLQLADGNNPNTSGYNCVMVFPKDGNPIFGLPLADGIRLENDLSTLLRTTEDRVEGAKAFVEKRKPRWTGR